MKLIIKFFRDKIIKNEIHTKIAFAIILSGVLLAVITECSNINPNIWYLSWMIFPYAAYFLTAIKAKSMGSIIGGGLFLLGIDIVIHIQVFYFPESSTDSLVLLTMPFWQSVLIMPLGFLFGWLIERMIAKVRKLT